MDAFEDHNEMNAELLQRERDGEVCPACPHREVQQRVTAIVRGKDETIAALRKEVTRLQQLLRSRLLCDSCGTAMTYGRVSNVAPKANSLWCDKCKKWSEAEQ